MICCKRYTVSAMQHTVGAVYGAMGSVRLDHGAINLGYRQSDLGRKIHSVVYLDLNAVDFTITDALNASHQYSLLHGVLRVL